MSQHVFISYLRENKSEVEKLVNNLQAEGIEVWWDEYIGGGEIGWDEVRQAIKDCYAFVLCLSKERASQIRSGIYREISEATRIYLDFKPGETFIIPVRLSDCEIPSFTFDATRKLEDLQRIDLFPLTNRSEGVKRLINKIHQANSPDKPTLRQAFEALENEKRKKKIGKPKRGKLVPKCCNRKLQYEQFKEFLFNNTEYCPRLPQICIIHGKEDEKHESLVERFCFTILRPFAH